MKHVQLDVDSCTPKTAVTMASAINKEEYSCQCCHPAPQGEEDWLEKNYNYSWWIQHSAAARV